MAKYDAIVIGGGHNGLICAAYLAKNGKKVFLAEASDRLGGLASEREFHPGFKTSPVHSVTHFSGVVEKALNLSAHGLEFSAPKPTVALKADGSPVSVLGDSVTGVSNADTVAYKAFRDRMQRYAAALSVVWSKTMPRIGAASLKDSLVYGQAALKLRMLGAEEMGEFVRVLALPMRDLVTESFDDPSLQALLSWDGLIGGKMAPRSPNNAVLPFLLRMSGSSNGDFCVPKGGVAALVRALENAAASNGVEIQLNAPVRSISLHQDSNGQRASGVVLENGEKLEADLVISSADPKTTFVNLIGARHIEIEFGNRIKRLRTDGYVAKFHAALSEKPSFKGVESLDGRFIIAPDLDVIEYSYDEAKYGEPSTQPVMEITIPSAADPGLAPDGKHVLSAHIMYAPYNEKTNWSEATRDAFVKRIIATLDEYAPGIKGTIEASELVTPTDIESEYRATGGHWHHCELSLEQMMMMRPTYGAAQYETPIPGVYLCGAGSHPGGGVMGMSGLNAAQRIAG